jgi:lipopolysaccharide biosynthesis regulator YciM
MADTDDFQDFREAVSRQTTHDEAAQQIKVARTCLEMGMTDAAIQALTTAAEASRHRFEASAMLGRLYRDRGDLPRAIEWFERAAGVPAPSAEEARALLGDLEAVRAVQRGD